MFESLFLIAIGYMSWHYCVVADGSPESRLNVKFVQDTSKFWYKPDISREQGEMLRVFFTKHKKKSWKKGFPLMLLYVFCKKKSKMVCVLFYYPEARDVGLGTLFATVATIPFFLCKMYKL